MLVIIRSGPDTQDGKRALKLARDMAADVCLTQNAVYFAQKERLEGFCGAVHVLDEDLKLRGLSDNEIEKDIRPISYNSLIDLMAKEEKVLGMF